MTTPNVTMAQVANKALDKASTIVEKAADAATDIFSAAAGIIKTGIDTYGPQVIDAVLWVVRIDAIQYLLMGWLAFVMIMGMYIWMWTGFTRREWSRRINEWSSDGFLYLPLLVVLFSATCVLAFSAIPRITDVWMYTAVYKPELYLVKKAVDIVERKLTAPTSTKK